MDYPLETHTARTRGDGMENESGTIINNNNKNVPIELSTQDKLKFTLKNLLTINKQLPEQQQKQQQQQQSPFINNNNNNVTNLQSNETTTTTSRTEIGTVNTSENNRTIPGQNSIYRGFNTTNQSLPPIIPKGKIFHLIPKLVKTINNNNNNNSNNKDTGTLSIIMKNKEPKFVPFEPYKGAVNPMVPPSASYQQKKSHNKIKLNKRNNLDLNVLVKQMSNMKTFEMNQNTIIDSATATATAPGISSSGSTIQLLQLHNLDMDKKLNDLKIERDYFESQLKFQVQVNTELKNLLVAAVGEDLQTKVNVLTEDKLQLARALLNSAENLSSHTEQIEYLAGASEVWRSKFLASSLMVEELARWKASLMQKNHMLLTAQKQMLENQTKIREMDIEMLRNLKFLAQIKSLRLPSANVLDLTAECMEIVQQLILHSGTTGIPGMIDMDLQNLDTTTDAEKLAVEALQNSNQPLMETDEALRAIVGQAFSSLRISSSSLPASPQPPSSSDSQMSPLNDENKVKKSS